jgi:hypothetical protein
MGSPAFSQVLSSSPSSTTPPSPYTSMQTSTAPSNPLSPWNPLYNQVTYQTGTPQYLTQLNQTNPMNSGQTGDQFSSNLSPMMMQIMAQQGQQLPGGTTSMPGMPAGSNGQTMMPPGMMPPQFGGGNPQSQQQTSQRQQQVAPPPQSFNQSNSNPLDGQLRQQFASWVKNRVGGMNTIPSGKTSIPSGQLPVTGVT